MTRKGASRPEAPDASQRPRRYAHSRERLLDAAGEVFAEQGLQGSLEDVARGAGVSMATLERHFATKEALVDALVRERRSAQRQSVDNRDRLLDAAAEVFAEQGLQGSVEDVARVAGLGTGTLYRHFPNKDALIDELVHELLADLLESARDALEEPDGQGLRAFLYAVGRLQSVRHAYACLSRMWNGTWQHAELRLALQASVGELLADAQRHELLRADVTEADVFMVMMSMKGVIEFTRDVEPELWQYHLETMLAGLGPSAEPRREQIPTAAIDRLVAMLTMPS